IEKAYIVYSPDLAVPSALNVIKQFVVEAKKQGLRRVVLLSQRGQENAYACENIIKESGLEWTILRPSWFAQNFSEGAYLDGVLHGQIVAPTNGAPEPFVDLDDVADVALAALIEDGHNKEIYEITGPESLTWDSAVDAIAKTSGRTIKFNACTRAEFADLLSSIGLAENEAGLFAGLLADGLDGRNSDVSDGLKRALGRQPKSFTQFAVEAKAQGCW
ncbi:MAG: NAD(P)H-binding protein, partial [Alphaproteobacteria bacterium]|nr:NAD(P)H-binding protein [Alphaproteobacteria bacterium]